MLPIMLATLLLALTCTSCTSSRAHGIAKTSTAANPNGEPTAPKCVRRKRVEGGKRRCAEFERRPMAFVPRAAFQLDCDRAELRWTKLSKKAWGVSGCGQRATFVEECVAAAYDGKSTLLECTWKLEHTASARHDEN